MSWWKKKKKKEKIMINFMQNTQQKQDVKPLQNSKQGGAFSLPWAAGALLCEKRSETIDVNCNRHAVPWSNQQLLLS